MNMNEWLESQETTDNLEEAIFILEDGTLIDGEFDMGMRGLDHNCIISLAPDHLDHIKKWEYIHDTFKVVRLVPETNTALINEGQELTRWQVRILFSDEAEHYEIEEY